MLVLLDDYFAESSARGGDGSHHDGPVVKRFAYWLDPLCLICCGFYALNRWIVKPRVHSAFLRGQFDDMLLIPCALPLVLWLQRKLRLRNHDLPPTPAEIFFHLLVWSVLFEVIGPHIMRVTGDPLDVLAYVVGGIAAGLWWNRPTGRSAAAQ